MKLYTVEIIGLITIEAESAEHAKQQVRERFYGEELGIDDLDLSIDNEEEITE